MANEIGQHDDPESVSGNGSVIAILKRNRTLLGTIAASGIIASAVVVSGRLSTAPAVATAAAPTYSEGTTVPLSTDLAGTLRTAAGGGGGGNPTGGRLDSLRRLDTLRYLADGQLDSVVLVRMLDSARKVQVVDSVRKLSQLPLTLASDRLKTNAVTSLATASSPSYGEGTVQALSVDLAGNLRVSSAGNPQAYMALINASAAAASKDHLNLFNASGSGVTLRIRKISVAPQFTGVVTGLVQSFEIREITAAGATCTAGIFRPNNPGNVAIPAQVTVNGNCTTDPTGATTIIVCSVDGEEARSSISHDGNCYLNQSGIQALEFTTGQGLSIRSTALSGAWPMHLRVEFTF